MILFDPPIALRRWHVAQVVAALRRAERNGGSSVLAAARVAMLPVVPMLAFAVVAAMLLPVGGPVATIALLLASIPAGYVLILFWFWSQLARRALGVGSGVSDAMALYALARRLESELEGLR